jgi:hypothetical protein
MGTGDQVVKLQLDQMNVAGPGVNVHQVVVKERGVVVKLGLDYRIDKAALLYFL